MPGRNEPAHSAVPGGVLCRGRYARGDMRGVLCQGPPSTAPPARAARNLVGGWVAGRGGASLVQAKASGRSSLRPALDIFCILSALYPPSLLFMYFLLFS